MAMSSAGPLRCPRDLAHLEPVEREKVQIDRCSRCAGVWFDAKELRKVTRDKELEQRATRSGSFSSPSGFACPRCNGACVEVGIFDVVVDTCVACQGVWVDPGELEEAKRELDAARLVADGGPSFRSFLGRL